MKFKTFLFYILFTSIAASSSWGLDRVSPVNGKITIAQIDHYLETSLGVLPITRSFQSEMETGIMGPGWSLGLVSHLDQMGRGLLIITQAGKPTLLVQKGSKLYEGPGNVRARFDNNRWFVSSPANITSIYNKQGLEILRKDANGNAIGFTYDRQGRLSEIQGVPGHLLRFRYGVNGLLSSIQNDIGRRCTYHYYTTGRLAEVQDADGWKTTYRYAKNGRLLEVHYPSGIKVNFRYDKIGRVSKKYVSTGISYTYTYGKATRCTRQDGFWWETEYNKRGLPLKFRDSLGRVQSWHWNKQKQLIRRRFLDGSCKTYTYDSQGRMVKQETGSGDILEMTYDGASSRPVKIVRNGAITRFAYDKNGNLLSVISPAGRKMVYQYDQHGHRISVTDGEGRTTRFEYDTMGNIVKQINPDNGVLSWQYNKNGQVTGQIDFLGNLTTITYKRNGMLDSIRDSGGVRVFYQYDSNGRLTAKTIGTHTVRYTYNKRGMLSRIDYPDKTYETITYDSLGNPLNITDVLGRVTRQKFDSLGRLIQIRGPSGVVMSNTFTGTGKLKSIAIGHSKACITPEGGGKVISVAESGAGAVRLVKDQWGRVTQRIFPGGGQEQRQYDPDGFLKAVTLPMGDTWNFEHNRAGQLRKVIFPDGGSRKLAYDAAGRTASITYPSDKKVSYRYSVAGLLLESTNARGQKVRYQYDKSGRLIRKKTPDDVWTYRYDARGNLVQVGNGKFTVRYSYDSLGRLIQSEYPEWGKVVEYEYDKFGRVVWRTDPDENRTHYIYDKLGRVSRIEARTGHVFMFIYDNSGRLVKRKGPNGTTSEYHYDKSGRRVASIVHRDPAGKVLASVTYRYDVDGNCVEIVNGDGKRQFRYDAEQRLIGEKGPLGRKAYIYGPGGKRTSVTGQSGTAVYSYDEAGRLVRAGELLFSYDADGNVVSRKDKDGTSRYFYDSENKLTRVELPNGRVVAYGYGPFGKRIWREVDGKRTYYLLDGDNLLQELSAGYKPLSTYIYAGLDKPLMSFSKDGTFRFFHQDDLGSILAISNAKGKVVASYHYDAFGNVMKWDGKDANQPFRFTGRPLDSATGLYDLRARFYDPKTGQFTSSDSVFGNIYNPVTLSPYIYALNNPLGYIDPYGLQTQAADLFNPGYANRLRNILRRLGESEDAACVYGSTNPRDYGTTTQSGRIGITPAAIRRGPSFVRIVLAHERVHVSQYSSGLDAVMSQRLMEREAYRQTAISAAQRGDTVGAAHQLRGYSRYGGNEAVLRSQIEADTGLRITRTGYRVFEKGVSSVALTPTSSWQALLEATRGVGFWAGMGNLAMAVGDIVGNPISAWAYGEDATTELDEAAGKLKELAIKGAAVGVGSAVAGGLLVAAAPAAAPVIVIGGAVVASVGLGWGAGRRAGVAYQEYQAAINAEQEVTNAIRGGKNQEIFTENQIKIVDAIEEKIRKIKKLIGGNLNELAELEMEVANRRNHAMGKDTTASDLRGIDDRISLMEGMAKKWQLAQKEYNAVRRSLLNLKGFGGIEEDLDVFRKDMNAIELPDLKKATELLSNAKQSRAEVERAIAERENAEGGGFGLLSSEDRDQENNDTGGFRVLGADSGHGSGSSGFEVKNQTEEVVAPPERRPGAGSAEFVVPGSTEARRAIQETEAARPEGRRFAANWDKMMRNLGEMQARQQAEANEFLKEGLAATGRSIKAIVASNLKRKNYQKPKAPGLPYKLEPVGPNWNPVDGWGQPGQVPSGTVRCPENREEREAKCANVNKYIRKYESLRKGSRVWTANIQRAYLYRAQCCGYRWTTEGPDDTRTGRPPGSGHLGGRTDIGLMGEGVDDTHAEDSGTGQPPPPVDECTRISRKLDEAARNKNVAYFSSLLTGAKRERCSFFESRLAQLHQMEYAAECDRLRDEYNRIKPFDDDYRFDKLGSLVKKSLNCQFYGQIKAEYDRLERKLFASTEEVNALQNRIINLYRKRFPHFSYKHLPDHLKSHMVRRCIYEAYKRGLPCLDPNYVDFRCIKISTDCIPHTSTGF